MAVTVGTYSHLHFQNLPSIEMAHSNMQKNNAEQLIATTIKDLFVREGMDRTFGLALMHRHFDLRETQKLVEYNGTSVAWDSVSKGMKAPAPHMWSFSSGGILKPTEFRYSAQAITSIGENELPFLAKFRKLLEEHGLIELFGLASYPGDDFTGTCEITIGNANINLQPLDYPQDL